MQKFTFIVKNQSGERLKGSEDAESIDELIGRLQARGLFVISVKAQGFSKFSRPAKSVIKASRSDHKKIKEDDLIMLARLLATALGSGVSLLKSLDVISRQIASKLLLEAVKKVMHDVESGFSFRDSLARYPKVFSNLWVNLVETGEASGSLPVVLDRMAYYLEVRAAFRKKVVSAMVYPMMLLSVAVLAILVFLIAIVPRFTEIFKGFGIDLPLATQILVFLSDFFRRSFLLIFVAVAGIIILVKSLLKTKPGKEFFDIFIYKIPMLNEFCRISETEKFCSGMATMLESGVPILYSLEISGRSSGSSLIQGIISEIANNVREGKPLGLELERSGFFPPMVSQMISMGEEIGEMDKMFKKVSAFYSDVLETKITRFTSMFEPLMIVIMGGVIGSMVVSMFLPIFKLATIGGGG